MIFEVDSEPQSQVATIFSNSEQKLLSSDKGYRGSDCGIVQNYCLPRVDSRPIFDYLLISLVLLLSKLHTNLRKCLLNLRNQISNCNEQIENQKNRNRQCFVFAPKYRWLIYAPIPGHSKQTKYLRLTKMVNWDIGVASWDRDFSTWEEQLQVDDINWILAEK